MEEAPHCSKEWPLRAQRKVPRTEEAPHCSKKRPVRRKVPRTQLVTRAKYVNTTRVLRSLMKRASKLVSEKRAGKTVPVCVTRTVEMTSGQQISDERNKLLFILALDLVPTAVGAMTQGPKLIIQKLDPKVEAEARARTKEAIFGICRQRFGYFPNERIDKLTSPTPTTALDDVKHTVSPNPSPPELQNGKKLTPDLSSTVFRPIVRSFSQIIGPFGSKVYNAKSSNFLIPLYAPRLVDLPCLSGDVSKSEETRKFKVDDGIDEGECPTTRLRQQSGKKLTPHLSSQAFRPILNSWRQNKELFDKTELMSPFVKSRYAVPEKVTDVSNTAARIS